MARISVDDDDDNNNDDRQPVLINCFVCVLRALYLLCASSLEIFNYVFLSVLCV